jgi:hypothetical protein
MRPASISVLRAEHGGILMSFSRVWRRPAAALMLAMTPVALTVAGPYLAEVDGGTFVNHAQLRDWLADGERGLWIQAGDLRWFYARFAHACQGLNATNSLLFDTRGSDNIATTSAVVVPGGARCTVLTFLPSDGPPKDRNAGVLLQPQAQ